MEEEIITEEITTEKTKEQKFNILNFIRQYRKKILIIGCAVIAAVALLIGVLTILNSIKAKNIAEQLNGMCFEFYEEDESFNVGGYYYWSYGCVSFDDDEYTDITWEVNTGRLNLTDKLDQVVCSDIKGDISVKVSLFGKVTVNNLKTLIIEDGEITGFYYLSDLYKRVEKLSLDDVLIEKGVKEVYDSITDSTIYTWSSGAEVSLLTVNELVKTFKETFTVSDLKQQSDRVMFDVSTGETILGFADDSGMVTNFQVTVSGSSAESLLEQTYHFYPLCHFVSAIKGETVKVDTIIDILSSVDPTTESSGVSTRTKWQVKKAGIEYTLEIAEYSTHCSMSLNAKIN